MRVALAFFIASTIALSISGAVAIYAFDYYEVKYGKLGSLQVYIWLGIVFGLLVAVGAGTGAKYRTNEFSARIAYVHAFGFSGVFVTLLWLAGSIVEINQILLVAVIVGVPFIYVYAVVKRNAKRKR